MFQHQVEKVPFLGVDITQLGGRFTWMSRYVFFKKLGKIVDSTSGHTVIQHDSTSGHTKIVGRFNIYPDVPRGFCQFIRHGDFDGSTGFPHPWFPQDRGASRLIRMVNPLMNQPRCVRFMVHVDKWLAEPSLNFINKSKVNSEHGQIPEAMLSHREVCPLWTRRGITMTLLASHPARFDTCCRWSYGGFLKCGYPKSSKSLDYFSIEMYWNNHGDLGVPHLKTPPYSMIFLNSCWTHHFFVRLIIYSLELPRVVPCKVFRILVPWNTWGNLFTIPAGFKNNPLSSNGSIFPSRIANLQHFLGLLTLPHFKTHKNESYLVGYIFHISPSFYPWWTLY